MSQLVRLEDIALVSGSKPNHQLHTSVINPNQTDIDTIEQSLFSTISRTQIRVHESEGSTSARWVAVKSASIHPRLSEEPHDIVKELRLLSGVSHANVRTFLQPTRYLPGSSGTNRFFSNGTTLLDDRS